MLTPDVLNLVLAGALALAVLLGLVAGFRARRKHHREQTHFFQVLDAVGLGILILRADGTIQYTNGLASDILRRPDSQILGKPFHRLLHEEANVDQPGAPCAFADAIRQHQPFRGHERFVDGNGRTVPVSVTGMPLGADTQSAVIAFRDRSNEIAQGREREEAFAFISHEVRSPLTALVGYSGRLQAAVASGALDVGSQYAEEITILAREAQRMREIILLILDMAEVESGRLEVEAEPIRMSRLVQDEIARLERDRPAARFTFEGDEVVVESDERYVRRIVQNLLDNAAKYGGDAKAVEVALSEDADGGCRVTVRDHGAGIPFDAQPRIFERFYRHASASTHGRGLGLGLYLSRRLATRLGGRLTFTSTPGDGASFLLTLPDVYPENQARATSDQAGSESGHSQPMQV